MRYIDIGGEVIPKHCKFGPRPAEGLLFNNLEWWSITDHLVKDQREREYAAVQKAKEDAKKDISYEMTRHWSNTLASIKTQANQKRLEKMEKEKQDKIDKYNEIMKARELEKKEVLKKARRMMFEDSDATRTINSAVGYSLAHEGWQKQIELKKFLKSEAEKKVKQEMIDIQKGVEDFYRQQLLERIRIKEKQAIQKAYLDEQIEEIKRRKKEELEEFEEEKNDLINMRIEGEKIHHCNMVERNYRKKFAARYMRKTEAQIEFERKLRLEQEEEDEINNIFQRYERRFKQERKEREEKAKNEAVEKRIRIAEKLAEKLREAARKEEQRLNAAAAAKEQDAMREEESKRELQELALKSLLDGKRKSEQRKARRDYERKEEKKWELMQQYRSAEINDEWRESARQRKLETQRRVRAGYDCQIKEMKEREARELKEWLEPLEDESANAEELLKFCQEAVDFVKEENLSEFSVLKAVSKVKEKYLPHGAKGSLEQQTHPGHQDRKSNPRSSITGCFCFKY